MTGFDDRKNAEEAKFANKKELEFKSSARRNKLLGLWAAERMGLSGPLADEYAMAVVKSDFEKPGEEDVFNKVMGDLTAKNLAPSENELRARMAELKAEADKQIHSGQ